MKIPIFSALLLALNKLGQKRANPEACPTNSLQLAQCECTNDPVCQDKLEVPAEAASAVVVSVDFDNETYPVGLAVNDPGMEAALVDIAKKKEINVSISIVTNEDGSISICHTGACTLTNFVVAGVEAPLVPTRCCLYVQVTTFKSFAEGAIPDLTYTNAEGVVGTHSFPTNPYAYSGTAATDDATAAQLELDLIACLTAAGVPFTEASVTVSAENEGYFLCYKTADGSQASLGTVPFSDCGRETAFVCESKEKEKKG